MDYNNDEKIEIVTSLHQVPIYETELKIINNTEIDKPIRFKLYNDNFEIEYEMDFKDGNVLFKRLSKTIAKIRFASQSTLEGNMYIDSKEENIMELDKSNIEVWDFSDIDIHKEFQKMGKVKNSIQYKVISKLKDKKDYSVIFDDDGSGEIADIVAIKEETNKINAIFDYTLDINIVQPGVDSNKIKADMNKILCVTKKYLMDTYGIKFKIICS